MAKLEAQNATGNWIKVVQRLAVRIALDPKELHDHPLRLGLSMKAIIDLHPTKGKFFRKDLAAPIYQTLIYDNLGKEADAEVNKVINENISKTARLEIDAIKDLNKKALKNKKAS